MVLDVKNNPYVQHGLIELLAGMIGMVSTNLITLEGRDGGLIGRFWAAAAIGMGLTSLFVRDMESCACLNAVTFMFFVFHALVGLVLASYFISGFISSGRSVVGLLVQVTGLAVHAFLGYQFFLILQKEDYLNKVALPEITVLYKEALATLEDLKKMK